MGQRNQGTHLPAKQMQKVQSWERVGQKGSLRERRSPKEAVTSEGKGSLSQARTMGIPSAGSYNLCDLGSKIFYFFFLFFFFFLFMAAPAAYGHSQARGCRPTRHPQQRRIRAASATYTTAHGNATSLTHWARPGIEPASSQQQCWVLNLLSHNRNSWE